MEFLTPSLGKSEYIPVCVSWRIIETNTETGEVVKDHESPNTVTNVGRDLLIKSLFMLTGSAGVICCGVGASTTAAAVTDTRLTHELNGNRTGLAGAATPPERKLLYNTSDAPLSPSDIVDDPQTISGTSYYKKLVCKATWASADGNNNHQFGEYALFTLVLLPSTPTGTSGEMFNHYIDPTPSTKGSGNAIVAQITVRF